MAQIKSLGGNNKAYSLANGEEIEVQSLWAVPAGREDLVIVCVGPNIVYYHTEGNPPGLGSNDNGNIPVNKSSSFTITASLVYNPKVYLHAASGPTIAAVFLGQVRLFSGDVLAIPEAVQKIGDLFK